MAVKKCPYDECIVKSNANTYIAQAAFLAISFFILVGSKSNFTPASVILYVVPPVIELVCKKCNVFIQKVIKYILVAFASFATATSFLLMSGTLIENGDFYSMSNDAMAFGGLSIPATPFAYSLLIIVFVPVFLRFSMGEKKDKDIVNQHSETRRKEKTTC